MPENRASFWFQMSNLAFVTGGHGGGSHGAPQQKRAEQELVTCPGEEGLQTPGPPSGVAVAWTEFW